MKKNIYYDFNTSNKSFLNMHKYLKIIGIKNNNFMLALHDKDLIGVDPWDIENLSCVMKEKILRECYNNFYYFIREVIRIPEAGGGYSRFHLNRANCAQSFLGLRYIDSIWLGHRYCRKTVSSEIFLQYMNIFHKKSFRVICRDKNEGIKICNEIFEKNSATNRIPNYLKFNINNINPYDFYCTSSRFLKEKNDADNNIEIFFVNDAEFVKYAKDIYNCSSYDKLFMGSSTINNYSCLNNFEKLNNCIPFFEGIYDLPKIPSEIVKYTDYKKYINKYKDFNYYNFSYLIKYSMRDIDPDISEEFTKYCTFLQNNYDIISSELLLERIELK